MSTLELKELLKSKIDEIKDESILAEINNLINHKIDYIALTNEQKNQLKNLKNSTQKEIL